MKDKIYTSSKGKRFSRREFLGYAATAGGLYLFGNPLKVRAQGTRPRVISVRDAGATNYDYGAGYYWEHVNQEIVNKMVSAGVKALTGAATAQEAWSTLIPYQSGQAVAIKVNLNNATGCPSADDNGMDACPETVKAVVDGLISIGVPPHKIWITDPSRPIPSRFINRIANPNVKYYTTISWSFCSTNTYRTDYVAADSPHASPTTHPPGDVVRPAQVFVDAAHLINIPLLKGHGTGWITLGLKNHYGSVTFKNYPSQDQGVELERLHQFISPYSNPDLQKSTLADISNNPHIRNKTRLVIGDGLFGHPTNWNDSPARWQIFGNDDPNTLFFGIDPIATDSVMFDYINEEQNRLGQSSVNHSCIKYGATLGLGTHDHWDSFQTKRYSLIDYVHIIGGDSTPPSAPKNLRIVP